MNDPTTSNWRSMFERGGGQPPHPQRSRPTPSPAYDDGYQPPPHGAGGAPPLTHADITDEAAMALALEAPEYKPWVLQRGSGRPAMMLHLRRYEPKSGLWCGWQIAYPHLVAVEYIGDKMLSLDFGARQFVIEGIGLGELARHLQCGSVLIVQEFSEVVWPAHPGNSSIYSVTRVGAP